MTERIWKVLACSVRMLRIESMETGNQGLNWLTQVYLDNGCQKGACGVCVCLLFSKSACCRVKHLGLLLQLLTWSNSMKLGTLSKAIR